MRAVLLSLLLLAPETHTLRLQFTKGMCWEETTIRSAFFSVKVKEETKKWDRRTEETLVRSVLEVDKSGHPTAEVVKVVKFATDVRASPAENEVGVTSDECEGKTFTWRRLEDRWGLFEGDTEVTPRHPRLVDRLKTWTDARLPKSAVAVGETWAVDARDYLETAGYPAVPEVKGAAGFKLKEVADGVATIGIDFEAVVTNQGQAQTWRQAGTLRFDVARGRDLAFEVSGTVTGAGEGEMKVLRTLTYR